LSDDPVADLVIWSVVVPDASITHTLLCSNDTSIPA
jgi:hypothetical protein